MSVVSWEEWETRPARVRMVRFTGFDPTGNGWSLLDDLHHRGILADRDPDDPTRLRIKTRERDESIAQVNDWIVVGTRGEVYPIDGVVQSDKYRRPTS